MSNAVLDGREPFMQFTVHTENGPVTVGKLWCKHGVFSFEGVVETSAKVLVDRICDELNHPEKYKS